MYILSRIINEKNCPFEIDIFEVQLRHPQKRHNTGKGFVTKATSKKQVKKQVKKKNKKSRESIMQSDKEQCSAEGLQQCERCNLYYISESKVTDAISRNGAPTTVQY